MTARAAGEEAVENVNKPKRAAERFFLKELIGITLVMVGVYNAEHLSHARSLPKIDVSTHGVAAAPLVDNQQTEGLDVGKTGLVKSLHDRVDCLGRKMFGSTGAAAVTAISANHGRGMPVQPSLALHQLASPDGQTRPVGGFEWRGIHLPGCRGQQRVDHCGIHRGVLQLL